MGSDHAMIFKDVTLLITCLPKSTKQELVDLIRGHGGIVQEKRIGVQGVSEEDLPYAVIAHSRELMSSRMLAALARGLAILTERWVRDCVNEEEFIYPQRPEHVLWFPKPSLRPMGVFKGLKVYIHGTHQFGEIIGKALVQGGAVIDHEDTHAIIVETITGGLSEEANQSLWELRGTSSTRRLRVPLLDSEWVRTVAEDGVLPAGIIKVSKKKRQRITSEWPWPEGAEQLTLTCTYRHDNVIEPPLVIISDDFMTLNTGAWMNTGVIEAGIEAYVWKNLTDRAREVTAFLEPTSLVPQIIYASSLPLDGSRHLVIAPICSNNHFSFVAFFFRPDGGIALLIHIDSLSSRRGGHDASDCLSDIWLALGREPVQVIRVHGTPQQPNKIDCGAYMLIAARKLIEEVTEAEDTIVEVITEICGADRATRRSVIAGAHAAGKLTSSTFLTDSWFTHEDTIDVRRIIAKEILNS